MKPSFTTNPAFLVAAEGRGRIEFVISISPNDSRIERVGHFKNFGSFVGPYPAAQSIRSVVSLGDRL